ncbi:MAG: hypothetical protein M0R74_00985 [Dehalococcoidia bacterium]|jgi:hypothetical protein|nr:hypothetical protein [Dehalococcoidia bacterium]
MPEQNQILVKKPRLEPAAQAAIAVIERDTGKKVTPEHVVWLQAAALEMVYNTRSAPALCDLPHSCGGVLFWPMTYFAAEWYQEIVQQKYGMDYRCIGFALAHAHQPEALRILTDARAAREAVNNWLLTLHCGPAQLRETVEKLIGRDELVAVENVAPRSDTGRASDWGDTIALLCEHYPGTDPIFWGTKVGIAYAEEMLMRAIGNKSGVQDTMSFSELGRWQCLIEHIKREIKTETETDDG